jgi:hypothetical protein
MPYLLQKIVCFIIRPAEGSAMQIQQSVRYTSQPESTRDGSAPAAPAPDAARKTQFARMRRALARNDTVTPTLPFYPDAVHMAPRFLTFEDRARAIERMKQGGAVLSVEDGAALRLYDTLRERLAFLREDAANPGRGPVANARVATLPEEPTRPDESVKEANPPDSGSGPSKVEYVGGVRIKSDYSLKEVIGTTATALTSPFASFIASAQDLVKKASKGEPLTAEEEEKVYRYAGIVDAFASMTPKGNITQLAGSVLDSLNTLVDGQTVDKEKLASDLTGAYKIVSPKQLAKSGSGASAGAEGKNPARPPRPPPAPRASSLVYGPIYPFDFPRFRITLPVPGPDSPEPRIVHKTSFNPPTRLPSGQVGYPLSPTRPPRLPDGKTTGPVAGPSGVSAAETGGARPRVPSRKGAAGARQGADIAQPKPSKTVAGDLKRIAGKGPLILEVPINAFQDRMRVDNFRTRLYFYRHDKDVNDMDVARPLRKTDYDERRDVIVVGSGEHVTSYVANSKFRAGKYWGGATNANLQGAEIVELGNGREGVGAIKLPFVNIRRGSSVIISGGAMNGCTMLFASDGHSLYAYHAGTAESNPDWLTSQQGAKSIVDAHVKVGPMTQREYQWSGDNTDLVLVGRQYPFSALIYSGRSMDNTQALVGAGATLGAVGGAADVSANAHLNVQRHEYGPATGPRWHMMTFNYHEYQPNRRTVGIAEAVVSRNLNGAVTVTVLAEKGTLDRGSSIGERGGPISYRYKTNDSDLATYSVPAPPSGKSGQRRP